MKILLLNNLYMTKIYHYIYLTNFPTISNNLIMIHTHTHTHIIYCVIILRNKITIKQYCAIINFTI